VATSGLTCACVISGHQWSSVVISGHQWSSVVISGHQWPDLRLRHRVALIVDDLDALWHALIHLLVLLLLVARALRIDETRAQPSSTAIRGHQCALTKLERSRHRVPAIA
jgi:hypothetical protein